MANHNHTVSLPSTSQDMLSAVEFKRKGSYLWTSVSDLDLRSHLQLLDRHSCGLLQAQTVETLMSLKEIVLILSSLHNPLIFCLFPWGSCWWPQRCENSGSVQERALTVQTALAINLIVLGNTITKMCNEIIAQQFTKEWTSITKHFIIKTHILQLNKKQCILNNSSKEVQPLF